MSWTNALERQVDMSWFDRETISVLRLNGSVELWRYNGGSGTEGGQLMEMTAMSSQILAENTALGLHTYGEERLIAVGNSGAAKVLRRADDEVVVDAEMALTAPVSCSAVAGETLVFGGKENDLEVWDLTTRAQTWKAKNVKLDNLSLRVPVWPTAIDFFHEKDSGQLHMLVMGSGHKHVRLYDTRAQRRPVGSMEVEDFRVTSIASLHDDRTVLVGNTAGDCFAVDVRKMVKMYPLKGGAGSIRQLHVTPDNKYASTVGLDRWLRVYSVRSHRLVGHCYLKNRLNCSLFTEDFSIGGDSKHGDDDDEDELGETIPYEDMDPNDEKGDEEEEEDDEVEELDISEDEEEEEELDNEDDEDDDYELPSEDDDDESSEDEPPQRKRSPKKQAAQSSSKRAKGGKRR